MRKVRAGGLSWRRSPPPPDSPWKFPLAERAGRVTPLPRPSPARARLCEVRPESFSLGPAYGRQAPQPLPRRPGRPDVLPSAWGRGVRAWTVLALGVRRRGRGRVERRRRLLPTPSPASEGLAHSARMTMTGEPGGGDERVQGPVGRGWGEKTETAAEPLRDREERDKQKQKKMGHCAPALPPRITGSGPPADRLAPPPRPRLLLFPLLTLHLSTPPRALPRTRTPRTLTDLALNSPFSPTPIQPSAPPYPRNPFPVTTPYPCSYFEGAGSSG